MKKLVLSFLTLCIYFTGVAQPGTQVKTKFSNYLDYQKTLTRPAAAMRKNLESLERQFAAKGLAWPAKYVYFRSFKYDGELEVWVRNSLNEPFQHFKTYWVCALAGTLGPKRMEGDYQVPEGFYFVNELKPNSEYHLSLGLNYPNASDKVLSDAYRPGSAIYIHGSCVTVGCIPITDEKIEELYLLAAYAKNQGQDFIPVHIFPVKFDVKKSMDYLESLAANDPKLKRFAATLEQAYDYFEEKKELPVILTADNGDYIVNDPVPKRYKGPVIVEPRKKNPPVKHEYIEVADIANFVHQPAEFPGGALGLTDYLLKTGNELGAQLPEEVNKLYLQVEFIIDKDGSPLNFKVIKGWNDYEFNDIVILKMKNMPKWKPAVLSGKAVAKKMVVGLEVERKK